MSNYLDSFLSFTIFQNKVQDYIVSILIFLISIIGLSIVKRFVIQHLKVWAKKTVFDFDDLIVRLISQIGWPVFVVLSVYMASTSLILCESIRSFIKYAFVFVVTIRTILLLQEIIQYAVNKTLIQRIGAENQSSKAMINSVVWIVKWGIWLLGGIFILDNLGVNITSLVAGIGIGGIAVAMASQAILGDAFSALSIYLDKPFEIGDFIIVDDCMGTVEYIGVKTTRLRSLSGEQLVFSNSDLTKSRVKNYKRMASRRIAFKIGVTYQTTVEQVREIPHLIKDIFSAIKDVRLDRVHFQNFGEFSLEYDFVYYVYSSDLNIYMYKQLEIIFIIMDFFEKSGIEFAYPTQTLYLNKVS